jgi:large subunit ribosomal protein L15
MSDFQLHAPEGANKKKVIVGRGQSSGLGTTAGRGNKGQNSRSGGKTYPGFEGGQMPLYRRLAHRGFCNTAFAKKYAVVNLIDLESHFENGETVNAESLIRKGLVKKVLPIKLLGKGEFTKKLTIQVDKVSQSAKERVEKAGGTVTATEQVAAAKAE